MFGVSPRPLTTSPFSVSAVCLLRLFAPCSSVTFWATTTPLALRHGPVPMRSRALTAGRAAGGLRAEVGAPGPLPPRPRGASELQQSGRHRRARRGRRRCPSPCSRRRTSCPTTTPRPCSTTSRSSTAGAGGEQRGGDHGERRDVRVEAFHWSSLCVEGGAATPGRRRARLVETIETLQAALPAGANRRAGGRGRRAILRCSARMIRAAPRQLRRCSPSRHCGARRAATARAPLPRRLRRASRERASSGGTSPARSRPATAPGASRSRSSAPRPASRRRVRAASRRASCSSRTPPSPTSRSGACATTSASRAAASASPRRRRRHRPRPARLAPEAQRAARSRAAMTRAASSETAGFAFELELDATQPVLLQGEAGVSRRARTRADEPLLQRAAARGARQPARSTAARRRSPAAPGSTTNGATRSSTRAPSAGTGSA